MGLNKKRNVGKTRKKFKLTTRCGANAAGIVIIIVAFGCASGFGKTLNEYKENVIHIKEDFANIASDDWDSASQKESFERSVFDEVDKLFPKTDFVEIDGTTVEVNNYWLDERVRNYKTEVVKTENKKLIATEIYERLEAIEQKLAELENLEKSLGNSKDENKQNISAILKREEYQKPSEEESLIQKLIRTIREWIYKLFPKPEMPETEPGAFQGLAYYLQIALYAVFIGIVGFLVYKFAPIIIHHFASRSKKDEGEKIILGEKLSANETPKTLFSEAERLAAEGNLKAAIRKGYIALLFELSERKVLGLAKHKTNRDYLRDVKKRRELYENMNGLTSNYERHCYGFDAVEFKDWEEFRNRYKEALGTVR